MNIVLLILKILAIIILVLLAILLSLIILALFVPVCYGVDGKWSEEAHLDARVSWLLHFIHIHFSWKKDKLFFCIRILGIPIYDSEKLNSIDISENISHISNENSFRRKKTEYINDTSDTWYADDGIKIKLEKKTIIQKIIVRFKSIIFKIKEFFRGIFHKIIGLFKSLEDVKRKVKLILDFLEDEVNKDGFRYTYGAVLKLLRHILPRKIKVNIIFGTGDPCSTGQVLGVVAVLYSIYGDKIIIIPDFEKQRFEGNAMVRGRIRLVTILIILIKLIIDRRFIQLRDNVRLLKEAL